MDEPLMMSWEAGVALAKLGKKDILAYQAGQNMQKKNVETKFSARGPPKIC